MIRVARSGVVAAVAISLALAGTACGGSDSNGTGQLLASRFDERSPHFFLDAIEIELDANEDITRCMKAQGFDYAPYSYAQEFDRLTEMVGTYDDVETFAEQFGYGITNPDLATPPEDYELQPIDVDYEIALYGRSVGQMASDGEPPAGCWGEFAGALLDAAGVFGEARRDLHQLVDADAGVEEARASWSRCMAEQGYSYYSPQEATRYFDEASSKLMFSFGPDNPMTGAPFDDLLTEEIDTAVADQVACGGAELRAKRLAAAQRIGLSDEAQQALQQLEG